MEKETKKAPNRKRVQLSFTINKEVNDKLSEYCESNLVNKSKFIESLIVSKLAISSKPE